MPHAQLDSQEPSFPSVPSEPERWTACQEGLQRNDGTQDAKCSTESKAASPGDTQAHGEHTRAQNKEPALHITRLEGILKGWMRARAGVAGTGLIRSQSSWVRFMETPPTLR